MAQTKDLFQAVEDGDLSIFQGLPATEIIDSHKDEDGNTLLSIAARNGRKEAVQLLLEKYNANIYAENSFQVTPLKYAAEYGYKDVVEILLQYANKIDSGAYGRAVSAAASKGHEDIIKLMLENNEIDEDARNEYGSRAIVVATKHGKTAIVKHLLGRDDINLKPAARHRALIEGTIEGHIKAVELLLQRNDIDINETDGKGRVPLIEAARNGQTKIMELLFMVENINVNVRSNYQTALDTAMRKNHHKVVELLFTRKDLDLEAAGVSLAQVIEWAGDKGFNDLKDSILATKSDLPGRTTLSFFAENGEVEILKLLLPEYDEDLRLKSNIKDHDGRTPLSRAAEKGHRAAVSLLIERDADVNLADRDGRTPLWVAVENGHEEVVEDLVSADTGTLLLLTQEGKQAAAIKLMQHEGLKIDQKDVQGRTALHLAALLGHYDIARHRLLLSKAEEIINSKDHTGETPLRLAIGAKHKIIVQELLNHKADTKDIEAKEWRQAYNKPEYDTVMLSKKRGGEQNLDFPATFLSREELLKTSTTFTSRLYLLTDDLQNPIWSKEPVSLFKQAIIGNKLQTKSYNLGNDTWDICISLRLSLTSYEDNQLRFVDNKISRVMWRMIQPKTPGDPWTPIVYFSTLPYGWIPDDDLDLFRQFIGHLKTPWLSFCNAFEDHLSDRRVEQLKMGDKLEMINFLAKDAQQLANLRSILASQTSDAEEFLKDYYLRFHREQALQDITMRFLKEEFQAGITQKLENLDQSVRDLLQFEFAWITIRETRIANKVGQNVMLLTYVSIFYLPLGFCAALWAIPNITDGNTRTPFIITAALVSLVTLLITFNMDKIAQGYQYCVKLHSEEEKRERQPIINSV